MKNMMLFLMALLMSGHMMAQQTIVTGVITDANDGSPLIGANVLVNLHTCNTPLESLINTNRVCFH